MPRHAHRCAINLQVIKPIKHKNLPQTLRSLCQRTGRSIGWAGDVVGAHKTTSVFYGLTGTGNKKTAASNTTLDEIRNDAAWKHAVCVLMRPLLPCFAGFQARQIKNASLPGRTKARLTSAVVKNLHIMSNNACSCSVLGSLLTISMCNCALFHIMLNLNCKPQAWGMGLAALQGKSFSATLLRKTKRSRLSGDDVYVMGCVAQRH